MNNIVKCKKAMSRDEVSYFVDLVKENKNINNKETNSITNRLKEEAWVDVTAAFNSKFGSVPRKKEQLKLKWDNLKKAARKRLQEIRLNSSKTGGGKPHYIPPDEILDKVAGLLGSTGSGFEVPFGGDSMPTNSTEFEQETEFATCELPNSELVPSTSGVKKRKINITEDVDEGVEGITKPNILFGTPIMKKSFLNSAKKKKDDGKLQKNLAIARYFNKKTEKLELEIKLLQLEVANLENNKDK